MSDSNWEEVPVSNDNSNSNWEEVPVSDSSEDVNDFLKGAGQGATFNFLDEILGGGSAALEKLKGSDKNLSDLYRQKQKEYEQSFDDAQKRSKWLYGAGELAGGAAITLPIGGAGVLAKAPLAAKMIQGAKLGAGYGAVSGLGASKETIDKPVELLKDTAKSAAFGGVAGGVISGASKLGEKGLDSIKNYLKNTPNSALGEIGALLELGSKEKVNPFARFKKGEYLGKEEAGQFIGRDAEDFATRILNANDKLRQNIQDVVEREGKRGVKINIHGGQKYAKDQYVPIDEAQRIRSEKGAEIQRLSKDPANSDRIDELVEERKVIQDQMKKMSPDYVKALDDKNKFHTWTTDILQTKGEMSPEYAQKIKKFQSFSNDKHKASILDAYKDMISSLSGVGKSNVQGKDLYKYYQQGLQELEVKHPEIFKTLLAKGERLTRDDLLSAIRNTAEKNEALLLATGRSPVQGSTPESVDMLKQLHRLYGKAIVSAPRWSDQIQNIPKKLVSGATKLGVEYPASAINTFTKKLYQMDNNGLTRLAKSLGEDTSKVAQAYANQLNKGLREENKPAINAVLFIIAQHPELRSKVMSQLGMSEENNKE